MSHFITDLELQLGSASPLHTDKYCYMFWSLDLLQGPQRCNAFTCIVLRCVLVFYFADIHVNIYIFYTCMQYCSFLMYDYLT